MLVVHSNVIKGLGKKGLSKPGYTLESDSWKIRAWDQWRSDQRIVIHWIGNTSNKCSNMKEVDETKHWENSFIDFLLGIWWMLRIHSWFGKLVPFSNTEKKQLSFKCCGLHYFPLYMLGTLHALALREPRINFQTCTISSFISIVLLMESAMKENFKNLNQHDIVVKISKKFKIWNTSDISPPVWVTGCIQCHKGNNNGT